MAFPLFDILEFFLRVFSTVHLTIQHPYVENALMSATAIRKRSSSTRTNNFKLFCIHSFGCGLQTHTRNKSEHRRCRTSSLPNRSAIYCESATTFITSKQYLLIWFFLSAKKETETFLVNHKPYSINLQFFYLMNRNISLSVVLFLRQQKIRNEIEWRFVIAEKFVGSRFRFTFTICSKNSISILRQRKLALEKKSRLRTVNSRTLARLM